MKKILAALALSVVALTGCAGDSEPLPRETVTVAPETVEPFGSNGDSQVSIADSRFAEAVRENTSATGSDEDIVGLAKAICEDLDDNPTLRNVETWVQAGVAEGFTPNEAVFVVGASIGAYCDEHINLAAQFDNKYGNGSST